MKLKCVVIDDEPLAQDVLVQYIGDCPFLDLVRVCSDALEAGDYLRSHDADLIFLDINMPRLSGIHFVKTLTRPVLVIFTTAYPEFAAEGFESDAVDYLVKPISFGRFMKAANKAHDWFEFRRKKDDPANQPGPDFILLRADKRIHKIPFGEIRCLEAMGDYIKVITADRTLVVHETFRNLESQLPAEMFVRIHKSFIVSLAGIRLIEGNQVDVAGRMLPIGLVYKEGLLEKLNLRKRSE